MFEFGNDYCLFVTTRPSEITSIKQKFTVEIITSFIPANIIILFLVNLKTSINFTTVQRSRLKIITI